VTALGTSLSWALIPFGGIVGGIAIAAIGISPALLALGLAYFVVTMLPTIRPAWRDIDKGRGPSGHQGPNDRVGEESTPTREDEPVRRRFDEPVRDEA
jgi:hypothetical protein